MLNNKRAIQEFKEIYQKEYGRLPEDSIVIEMATKLLAITDVIYRKIKKDWVKDKNNN